ncbi:hypothetical protein [Novipirellula artificiosorum]|uniref:Uncharacterized protein n=1 Tax=Novipirellula artificiosorum TaxID=2528016 RepID=A0A5C6DA69_9BACT|nr:hypothetical protein [Novipirellula artificiosorum]TWU33790.1 hypothetical protein Poly41_47880 [Novipirellula artificiosorum]
MRKTSPLYLLLLAACYVTFASGCNQPAPPAAPAEEHDHDHEGHDHDGHDHDDEDHEGHDHEGHDHDAATIPDNFDESVAALVVMRDTIRDGLIAGNEDVAHGPLHAIADLLEAIEQQAKDSSTLTDEQQAQAAKAVDSLYDQFGEIDARLHDEEAGDFEKNAEAIEEQIQTLIRLTAQPQE